MGIANLLKVIENTIPWAVTTVDLEKLRGYRVAIDVSIYFYKDVRSAGEKGWKEKLIKTILVLKKNGIIPVCIFDGDEPPIEKKLTQISRRETTNKTIENMKFCRHYLKEIDKKLDEAEAKDDDTGGEVDLEEEFIENIKKVIGANRKKTVFWGDPYSIREKLMAAIRTYELQTAPIGDNERIVGNELIEALGIPCVRAKAEAEALCAFMCTHGNCDAVLSEDSDVLVYKTPIFLSNLDIHAETVRVIQYQDVVRGLAMEDSTFMDMCIFAGCDYNKDEKDGKPFKIKYFDPTKDEDDPKRKPIACGSKRRYELFLGKWVSSIEEAAEKYLDPEGVDKIKHVRIREIFKEVPDSSMLRAPMSKPIDYARLETVFKKHNVKMKIDHVRSFFETPKIINKNKFEID